MTSFMHICQICTQVNESQVQRPAKCGVQLPGEGILLHATEK